MQDDLVGFTFDNSYARELEGCYEACRPDTVPRPTLLKLNRPLAEELGLDATWLDSPRGAEIFSGNEVPLGAFPLAQAYAGHQFGGFSPQLGDGRALLVGEVIDRRGERRDVALKGSGRTPFSRRGDGKAAVGPVLREFLVGEAMHALGIPTTRALAAVATGETIHRERPLPGAVLTRVAASHLRVGTFEFFAARGDHEGVRRLADYAVARHYPSLAAHPDKYLELLRGVTERQARLVAQWMLVGFIHGVMNTDNMTISGETIDYGPCAFLEAAHPGTVFSSIDHGGRYAYGNQPSIAQWNLARLAEALLATIRPGAPEDAIPQATAVLDEFPRRYEAHWLTGVRDKLGLNDTGDAAGDATLATNWLTLLASQSVDFTLAWRRLAAAAEGDALGLSSLFEDTRPLDQWMALWRARSARESLSPAPRAERMRRVNPLYIPRNHRVEDALAAASTEGDLRPFEALLAVVRAPFDARDEWAHYAEPAPAAVTAAYRTFCGT